MARDYSQMIDKYIKMEIETLEKLDQGAINQVMNVLEEARNRRATIFICGNGGSAATASHFAGDFNKGVNTAVGHTRKYRFVCLSDNIASMMAVANDISYDEIFLNPLEHNITENDLLIGISGSGNSQNVVLAMEYARSVGAQVIGMTGYNGGKVFDLAEYRLHVPIDNMQIAEDVHMIFEHLMMWILAYAS